MVRDDSEKSVDASGKFDHLRKDKMLKVEHLLKKGDYVEGADLAAALREQADASRESSNDRYTPYRCSDMAEVARRLADYLDSGRNAGSA